MYSIGVNMEFFWSVSTPLTLLAGYVLKRDQKKEEKTEITIEELVDTERAALGSAVTKVTLESFLKWKQRKLQEKKEALAAERAKKKKSVVEGKLSKVRLAASL